MWLVVQQPLQAASSASLLADFVFFSITVSVVESFWVLCQPHFTSREAGTYILVTVQKRTFMIFVSKITSLNNLCNILASTFKP